MRRSFDIPRHRRRIVFLHADAVLKPTAFSPFTETTDYFGDSKQMWRANFRVRDLDAMTAQLRAEGHRR